MDFTKYIESCDIAEHMRKIGYTPTAPEVAFAIYQNKKLTLEEKFSAWESVTANLPNCSMKNRVLSIPDFHAFLEQYMDLKRKQHARFYESDGAVYFASFYRRDESGDTERRDDTSVCFSDPNRCISYMKEKAGEQNHRELALYAVYKTPVYRKYGEFCRKKARDCADQMILNRNGAVCSFFINGQSDEDDRLDESFNNMWFAFPTPFQRGDILVSSHFREKTIFVLKDLSTWNTEEMLAQGISPKNAAFGDRHVESLRRNGCAMDMNAVAYCVNNSGHLFWDWVFDFLSFEKLREPLSGNDMILLPLSRVMKGEINAGEFHGACSRIEAGEALKRRYADKELKPMNG